VRRLGLRFPAQEEPGPSHMVFEDGSLWLPILDDGVVLRVVPPA
jgi:hypothetical protein